jgi:hypothetical protein
MQPSNDAVNENLPKLGRTPLNLFIFLNSKLMCVARSENRAVVLCLRSECPFAKFVGPKPVGVYDDDGDVMD